MTQHEKWLLIAGGVATLAVCGVSPSAHAWSQDTHKRIVQDAIRYMQAHRAETQIARLEAVASAAGLPLTQLADTLGQGAYDVDDFEDTYLDNLGSESCGMGILGAGLLRQ